MIRVRSDRRAFMNDGDRRNAIRRDGLHQPHHLATVTAYVGRLLAQRGSDDGDEGGMRDEWADDAPVLAGLAAASVQGRIALGARAGARVRRRRTPKSGRATRVTTASICMPDSVCQRINEIVWSVSVGTPCGRPSRTIVST